MSNPGTKSDTTQHLCAILFADMVGYSSLRQADALQFKEEMLTLAREGIQRCEGRVVKTLGDGFLAEFPAATSAVVFAIELQERVASRNKGAAARQRFRLRIGIHAGEVVLREGDIEGTTVNIAARTEPLAGPGGICLTEEVWQQVRETLTRPADRLGRLRVKGIRRQLCFYYLHPPDAGWSARWKLRGRLFLNWPGRLPGSILAAGLLIALAVWLRPFAADILEHVFPPTALQRVQRARQQLERYDLPDHTDRAMANLLQALPRDSADPLSAEVQSLLSLAYWRRYQVTADEADRFQASKQSSSVVSNFPGSHVARFVQGVVAMNENRLADATNHLACANDAAKWEDGEVLLQLAFASQLLKDSSGAANFERAAWRVKRKPWYFFNTLGRYRFLLDDLTGAQTNLEAALAIAGDSPTVLLNLGLMLEVQGEGSRALAYFRKALRLWPAAGAYGMGQHYLRQTNRLAAATNFLLAAQLNPARYDFPGLAGLALIKVPGRQSQAVELLANAQDKVKSLLNNAWNPVAAANLGLYQAALGDAEQSCRTFETLWQQYPSVPQVSKNVSEAIERMREQGKIAEADRLQRMIDDTANKPNTPPSK
jgi:class 3 adenylate cyclase/tetratricopeptide (TPR) repeat protein